MNADYLGTLLRQSLRHIVPCSKADEQAWEDNVAQTDHDEAPMVVIEPLHIVGK